MEITIYQIDAFANSVFEGNPAAVCPLDAWLPDSDLQNIALENNLSETAFFVKVNEFYDLRWFTPSCEVDLCGHATLASAHVIFSHIDDFAEEIQFKTRSGILGVVRIGDRIQMDFPRVFPVVCELPAFLGQAFTEKPVECFKAEDYVLLFDDEEKIINANPNLQLLLKCELRGVSICAKSKSYDFVTRFFAPKYGINEDPVTGSAFTYLAPLWSERLNKSNLLAKQVSQRGGIVEIELEQDRVKIAGKCAEYLQGVISI